MNVHRSVDVETHSWVAGVYTTIRLSSVTIFFRDEFLFARINASGSWMKTFLKWVTLILILNGLGLGVYFPLQQYLAHRNKVNWRTEKVVKGNIRAMVNSTGTVQPKLKVAIGSFVSGPIIELNAEFNQEVKKGDILARIDPLTYQANYARDKALVSSREADVNQMKVQLQQAINDEKRALTLHAKDASYIASSEMDKFKFGRLSLEAQVNAAETAIDMANATMENSLANLNYTKITAPVDGMVINRKIDMGQTVAASFQTPELFVIAPDMRVEMHVHASVDEADIGLIKSAQREGYPVKFTVDAYPDELFEGRVHEVRLNSTTTQNVVTYPVIVAAPQYGTQTVAGNDGKPFVPGGNSRKRHQNSKRGIAFLSRCETCTGRRYPDSRRTSLNNC